MKNVPLIETQRLLIKPYVGTELAALFGILSDPETMAFWPAPFTEEQASNWLERNMASYGERGFGRCGVYLKKDGTMIGDCGLMRSEIDGTPENDLGYIIHASHWGKGYGYEAAKGCLEFAAGPLRMTRVCANMPWNHSGSERVAAKLGMTLEKQFSNARNRGILTYLYSIEF